MMPNDMISQYATVLRGRPAGRAASAPVTMSRTTVADRRGDDDQHDGDQDPRQERDDVVDQLLTELAGPNTPNAICKAISRSRTRVSR
jgi:hypothetical protein